MALPLHIRARDGSLAPFDPASISLSLFAATEGLGRPDPFLARELTDGVLHFLSEDAPGDTIAADQLDDLVVKVVRELGQPAVAQACERFRQKPAEPLPKMPASEGPVRARFADEQSLTRALLSDFSLREVFSRDLVAAHRDGFLELVDAAYPLRLRCTVLPLHQLSLREPWGIVRQVEAAAKLAGHSLIIDALDVWLAEQGADDAEVVRLADEVRELAASHGLAVELHLNRPRSEAAAAESLFPFASGGADRARRIAEVLASQAGNLIHWHIREDDADSPIPSNRLRLVLERRHSSTPSATLGRAELHIDRFVEMLGGGPLEGEVFLKKLASLARMARAVAVERQRYLQEHGRQPLRAGFLLERAVFDVVPRGLVAACAVALGGRVDEGIVVELAARAVQTLETVMGEPFPTAVGLRLMWEPRSAGGDNRTEANFFGPVGEGNSVLQRQLRHASSLSRVWRNAPLCLSGKYLSTAVGSGLADLLPAARRAGVAEIFADL